MSHMHANSIVHTVSSVSASVVGALVGASVAASVVSAAGVVVGAAAAADCSFSLLAVAADSSIDSAAVGG